MSVPSTSKTYFIILYKSIFLTIRNFPAFILFTIYSLIFYFGCLFYLEKEYLSSILTFLIFCSCISSTFYITGKIVKNGIFSFADFIKSFKAYFFRANSVLIFWFAIFFFINQFIITPISSVIKDDLLLYFIKVPLILLIFFILNSLPEAIYSSDDNIESIFMSSVKFMEKHWIVWLIPNILFLFLLNLFDHRISIMPTLGSLDSNGILLKIQDMAFYIRSLIFTVLLIFRGLLYSYLTNSQDVK